MNIITLKNKNIDSITSGHYILDRCNVKYIGGNAVIHNAKFCKISKVAGGATIKKLNNESLICHLTAGAKVEAMTDRSKIDLITDKAVVKELYHGRYAGDWTKVGSGKAGAVLKSFEYCLSVDSPNYEKYVQEDSNSRIYTIITEDEKPYTHIKFRSLLSIEEAVKQQKLDDESK